MPIHIYYISGREMREIRDNLGYSQRELAKKSGVSQGTISKFESGLQSMNVDQYFTLIHYLRISVEFRTTAVA